MIGDFIQYMKRIAVALFILLSITLYAEQLPVPPLWGHRVHDEANVLAVTTVDNLEKMLADHEKTTTNQIAVLVIPSLEGNTLEEYSLRVARSWKLGQKQKNNGILLLIVVNDRKMRIEVGTGLTDVLTNAGAAGIIKNRIAPAFRDQDYDRGVLNGAKAIMAVIGSGYETEPATDNATSATTETATNGLSSSTPADTTLTAGTAATTSEPKKDDPVAMAIGVLFMMVIVVALSYAALRARSNFMSWFAYIFFAMFYSFPAAIHPALGVVTFLGFLIGYPLLRIRIQNARSPQFGGGYNTAFAGQPNASMPANNSGYVGTQWSGNNYIYGRQSSWFDNWFSPRRRHYRTSYRDYGPSTSFWSGGSGFGSSSSRRRDDDSRDRDDSRESSSSSSRGFSGGGGGFSGGGASGSW